MILLEPRRAGILTSLCQDDPLGFKEGRYPHNIVNCVIMILLGPRRAGILTSLCECLLSNICEIRVCGYFKSLMLSSVQRKLTRMMKIEMSRIVSNHVIVCNLYAFTMLTT